MAVGLHVLFAKHTLRQVRLENAASLAGLMSSLVGLRHSRCWRSLSVCMLGGGGLGAIQPEHVWMALPGPVPMPVKQRQPARSPAAVRGQQCWQSVVTCTVLVGVVLEPFSRILKARMCVLVMYNRTDALP